MSERDDSETRRRARDRRISRAPGSAWPLAERGRELASQREDLIAGGADPADLPVPLHPGDLQADEWGGFEEHPRLPWPPEDVDR